MHGVGAWGSGALLAGVREACGRPDASLVGLRWSADFGTGEATGWELGEAKQACWACSNCLCDWASWPSLIAGEGRIVGVLNGLI